MAGVRATRGNLCRRPRPDGRGRAAVPAMAPLAVRSPSHEGGQAPRGRLSALPVRVLDQNDFVASLVVHELVNEIAHEQDAEASRAHPKLLTLVEMRHRIALGMADCCMLQVLAVEARAGIAQ